MLAWKNLCWTNETKLENKVEEHDLLWLENINVTDHLRKNPDHTIEYYNPLTLAQENNEQINEGLSKLFWICFFFAENHQKIPIVCYKKID